MHVSALARYPVKSCRGQALDEAVVEPWGLAGDRRWMVVEPDGEWVTARTRPRMVLIEPALVADGLLLHAPGAPDLHVAVPAPDPCLPVRVGRTRGLPATPAAPEADAWFSAVLGEPVRLVHLDDPGRRTIDPAFSRPTDRVSFADGYPLLLTAEASLAALGALLPGGPVPMTRFRPNVVVTGAPAWTEEGWSAVTIGDAAFRVAKPSSRCVLVNVDPVTAEKAHEPLATLTRHRRQGTTVPFGVNLVPDTPSATLRVGDRVVPLAS